MTREMLSLVEHFEPALVNHLLQSTMFAAVIGMLTLSLRKNRAHVRHWLWLAASVKFLIPFSLLVALGSLLPNERAIQLQQPVLSAAFETVGQSFSAPIIVPDANSHVVAKQPTAYLRFALVSVWLCGTLAVLVVWTGRWKQIFMSLRQATPTGGREIEVLRRLESQAWARSEVAMLGTSELMEPGVFGIFRPVLLWPLQLTERLEDEHIESILVHELMHVQRHDNLIATIHMAVEALFWFHPLVWWIGSRMLLERERACDEATVQVIGKPSVYAESLLKASRFCIESPIPCVSGMAGSDLKNRVIRIMTAHVVRTLTPLRRLALGTTAFLSLTIPVFCGVVRAAGTQNNLTVDSARPRNIAGVWQGSLPTVADSRDSRVVINVKQSPEGTLSGTLTLVDRGATAIPLLSVTYNAPEVKFGVADISYQGTLSGDGKSLTGVWTRGATKESLTLSSVKPGAMWKFEGPAPAKEMDAAADPTFEVATIKPSPAGGHLSIDAHNRIFQAKSASVFELAKFAYHLRDRQVEGGPSWMKDLQFDVMGQPDKPGLPSADQDRLMMRKLLAERFHLAVHETQPVFSVYALAPGKTPAKLVLNDSKTERHGSIYPKDDGNGTMAVQFAWETMPEFVDLLMNFIQDRQIIDETGLKGQYDFTLSIPSSVMQGPDAAEGDRSAAFFKAVQALGFQLDAKKERLRVIVIERLEKPTPN